MMWGQIFADEYAAATPLPFTPEACLRHDAGRGRGWGYQEANLERLRIATAGPFASEPFPFVVTPPLTPPRQAEGNRSAAAAR